MSLKKFVFQRISKLLAEQQLYITKSLSYRKDPQVLPVNFDYIRYSTLGLCYEEIIAKNVKGNVAELGVYKGNFSKRLNLLFPDRLTYLFDTFEGFDGKDIRVDQEGGFSKGGQDFSDTSVEAVMKKMPFPEKCIPRKGFFPETAQDVNDSFCFVNIDTDLYEPIYQGLVFFYPRVEKGGYIFVHDFNNAGYKGARTAVLKFCKDNDINYVPIPDSGGSVIIAK